MKTALLLTTYNRPEYLNQCLWSLERADLSRIDSLMIVDDASTNKETNSLLEYWDLEKPKHNVTVIWSQENKGVKSSLLYGYDELFQSHDIVINIDSDAIVRPDFVNQLLDSYFCGILTGFHSTTKNANGTERHKILYEEFCLYVKQSIGGINICINKEAYIKYVKPALLSAGNWDHNACINAGYAYCLKESVVQHIGFDSSMGHNEQPDIADDFYYWDLPDVTLIGVDNQPERLQPAIDKCTKWIKFGDIVKLHPDITSKEQYSEYCITELYKHVKTSHMLICQHDGFINNWMAWDNNWLQYDYIGAPWWYNDGHDVGNGGFSLRSKRLMEIVATDPNIKLKHPEDDVICRAYRSYLEKMHNIKFAPLEVAEKFSFEGYRQPNKILKDQFGVHGQNPRKEIKKVSNEKYVIGQFQGLGDILFLVPMVRALIAEGNEIIWPIADHYFNIAKHFPDITMIRKSEIDVPYNSVFSVNTSYGKWLPYRYASELMGRNLTLCMQSKYELYGHNWKMWRELFYKRDKDSEKILIDYLQLPKKFQLINRHYGEPERGMTITPNINPDLPIIEMRTIEGFSLIDWLGVVEKASEIHASNSSLNYLIELMDLDIDVYLYPRKMFHEAGFEFTRPIFNNKCFKFIEQ